MQEMVFQTFQNSTFSRSKHSPSSPPLVLSHGYSPTILHSALIPHIRKPKRMPTPCYRSRVINFKFPLQPHHKVCGTRLFRVQMSMTTLSHYLVLIHIPSKCWENVLFFFKWEWEGKIYHLRFPVVLYDYFLANFRACDLPLLFQ